MVAAVRRGASQRSVARRYGVSLRTVQKWVARAEGRRLDRVDWGDRARGPREAKARTPRPVEDLVLQLRRELREESDLGEFGAAAIAAELVVRGIARPPCARTVHRILQRRGALDGRHRQRRKPPPKGWYLPDLAAQRAEADQIDLVEDLKIKDGPLVGTLNVVSLHGGLVGAFPCSRFTSAVVRGLLVDHWREVGLPDYAQFDNDTRFQGPHQHRDVVGSVARLCLSLGVIPVYAPPRESGFQAGIENFNGQWQLRVWTRFQHASLADLQDRSDHYVTAHRRRSAIRREAAPERRAFPADWKLNLQARPRGTIVFVRRTSDQGHAYLLGRTFLIDPNWVHRLVRCDVHLDEDCIRFHALRRSDPEAQPLLAEAAYCLPDRPFEA